MEHRIRRLLRRVMGGHLPLGILLGVTGFAVFGVSQYVDLRPHVEPNFFFSSDDPAFQADREISNLFPNPPQVIVSIKGPVQSKVYHKNLKAMTKAIQEFPEVIGVQSMTKGPGSFRKALKSPLWRRIILAEEGRASNIFILIKDVSTEYLAAKLERLRDRFEKPGMEVIISGVPYVLELIRRQLGRDFQVFSLAAFLVLGCVTFVIFRSIGLVIGVLVSCANASMLTLVATHMIGIRVEVLTANLAAIVFVLCLSHLVFMTFNWQARRGRRSETVPRRVFSAVERTLEPSFWSMLTTLLGFASLLFVQAAPLRNLGQAGIVGTLMAFLVAYSIYPWFLRTEESRRRPVRRAGHMIGLPRRALGRREHAVVGGVIVLCLVAFGGAKLLNTDPSLLSYFAPGSEIHEGLTYVDRNLGSSPLKIVVSDPKGKDFDSSRTYRWLWRLQRALEEDHEVGSVVSLPLILAEARRMPLVALLPVEWVIEAMELRQFDEIARYFLTDSRHQALFWLLMREEARVGSRVETVRRLKMLAESKGFQVDLVGGIYLLQGELAALVTSSLRTGLSLLIAVFVGMAWVLSGSGRTALAMLISLCLIPMWLLGLLGHFGVPFDVISAPAVNLAIAMGIDAMLHMLSVVRRHHRSSITSWGAWVRARNELWRPVIYSAAIVCIGFAIFGLSAFPPTQRFGLSIVLGIMMSPVAALFVLPILAGSRVRRHMVPTILQRQLFGTRQRRR